MKRQSSRPTSFAVTFFTGVALLCQPAVLTASSPETLVLFDPAVPETPESVVIDSADNVYISLALTGEIRRISPDGTQSTVIRLPIGAPCGGQFPPVVVLGLAVDHRDRLYAAVSACDPSNTGVWMIDQQQAACELLANLPSSTVVNGLEVHKDWIYAADTFGGMVWRIPTSGGVAEVWTDHPLLHLPPDAAYPGPNGIRYFRDQIYVAVSATGNVVAIPILPSGAAGEPRIHATLPNGTGCDEFVFDHLGRAYCTTSPFQTLVRLDPDGTSHVMLTAADGVDGPSSVAFGQRGRNRSNLYITNAAFPWQTVAHRPSLMRIRLDVVGEPR